MLESWCGVVVGLMGEWWPVCAQVGPLCGSVGRVRLVFVCLSWWCGVRRFLRGGVSGTSGLSACCRDDRASCRRLSRGVARERGASWCLGDVFLCCGRGGVAAYGQVFLRRDRLGIVCSCARVLVCSCARWDYRLHCRSGSPEAAFPQPLKVVTSAPYTSGGASWQPCSCVVVVS